MFETYPKVVKLAIKNFPLPNHKFARQAAVAALAADRQGKFWEFHDELYKNYSRLSEEKIQEIAQQLGLDTAKLDQDMKSPEINAIVEKDLRDGQEAGVRGIPTIFINGRLLRDRSFAGFQAAIEKELAEKGKKKE
ncbi:MAG: thioredoxin domain-containing protein [Deltaproteobacteria bacterium]|nr:thioredoxin domain-containing protein [Deltaproteobacteria bacterium]